MNTLVLTPEIDTRHGSGKVRSRIGLESAAHAFSQFDNLFEICQTFHAAETVHCVFVDEAQFLSKSHVGQLGRIADELKIPVLAFGLRTDFQGELFEGSHYLLAWADVISEIKTICHCGRKATMVLRMDAQGNPVRDGAQIKVGGNESYVSVCRQHHRAGLAQRQADELPFED